MKNLFYLLIFTILLSGCEMNTENVSEDTNENNRIVGILENLGYTDIELGGMPMFECSEDDSIFASSKFMAMNDDIPVSGTVCCGLFFKGCTVRY